MKAFPVTKFNSHRVGHDGMDLWDYFAAKAMAALIPVCATHDEPTRQNRMKHVVDTAAEFADLMMEVRQR